MNSARNTIDGDIASQIQRLGREFGFQQVGFSDCHLDTQHPRYHTWLERNFHGEMHYMARNVDKRLNPPALVEGTLSVICVRMDYLHAPSSSFVDLLDHPSLAYISRYALGRDYHKLIRKRLQGLAEAIGEIAGAHGYRVFTDSAPVLEKALAVKAGIGWMGKHSNILHREHGSWFFLGEIFTDLPLPVSQPLDDHCGDCSACIEACPTGAIVAPYVVDARRCISYLTIEHRGVIDEQFRAAMGNRIYGCDDCQLVCPWNRFEQITPEVDFKPRHGLDSISLAECFEWTQQQFLDRFEGSAIRRIGYACWRRNIVIALGNAAFDPHIMGILNEAVADADDMLREHLVWAIAEQQRRGQKQ